MDPLSDNELDYLLSQWKTPAVESLTPPVRERPGRFVWLSLLRARIAVPMPLFIVLVVAPMFSFWFAARLPQGFTGTRQTHTLADFRAVQKLEPRLVKVENAEN